MAAFHPYSIELIVLCPRIDVIAARDQSRGKTGYPDRAAVVSFDHILRSETPHLGNWLDTSDLTLTETVEHILVYLDQVETQRNSLA